MSVVYLRALLLGPSSELRADLVFCGHVRKTQQQAQRQRPAAAQPALLPHRRAGPHRRCVRAPVGPLVLHAIRLMMSPLPSLSGRLNAREKKTRFFLEFVTNRPPAFAGGVHLLEVDEIWRDGWAGLGQVPLLLLR